MDTPEVDAEVKRDPITTPYQAGRRDPENITYWYVKADFARKLERERDRAEKLLREYEALFPHGRLGEAARAHLSRKEAK